MKAVQLQDTIDRKQEKAAAAAATEQGKESHSMATVAQQAVRQMVVIRQDGQLRDVNNEDIKLECNITSKAHRRQRQIKSPMDHPGLALTRSHHRRRSGSPATLCSLGGCRAASAQPGLRGSCRCPPPEPGGPVVDAATSTTA